MYRFHFEEITVDVMSTHEIGWTPGSPWFEAGFKDAITVKIGDIPLKILTLPVYLATKIAAFYDRGKTDPRTSNDFEDIVYLLSYTSYLKDSLLNSERKVQLYLKQFFTDVLLDPALQEAIIGNLYYENKMARYNMIINLLKEISDFIPND